jgi:hypothetical protein
LSSFASLVARRPRRFARGLAVALCAAVVGVFAQTPAQGRTPPESYVALGDSYTAGPIIPVQQNDPFGCLRSDHN